MSRTARMTTVVGVALAGGALLTGCGGDEPAPDVPPDGVLLEQNIPTTVEGFEVVASNIDGDEAVIGVSAPESDGHEDVSATEGETVTVQGLRLRVETVEDDGPGEDEPTNPDGYVVVVPSVPQ